MYDDIYVYQPPHENTFPPSIFHPPQEQLGPQALLTDTWQLAIPQLYELYPHQQMIVHGMCCFVVCVLWCFLLCCVVFGMFLFLLFCGVYGVCCVLCV